MPVSSRGSRLSLYCDGRRASPEGHKVPPLAIRVVWVCVHIRDDLRHVLPQGPLVARQIRPTARPTKGAAQPSQVRKARRLHTRTDISATVHAHAQLTAIERTTDGGEVRKHQLPNVRWPGVGVHREVHACAIWSTHRPRVLCAELPIPLTRTGANAAVGEVAPSLAHKPESQPRVG